MGNNFKNPWDYKDSIWYNEEREKWGHNKDVTSPTEETPKKTGSILICYGLGAELGNFEVFANALKTNHLKKDYEDLNIKIVKTKTRIELFDTILNSGLTEIKQFHIFSHAIGAGLFLGYHDAELNRKRGELIINNPGYNYDMVINHEVGALLTDHFIVTPLTEQPSVKTILKDLDFIKLWGCNTGVENWVYSDIYWEKLNDKNTPKPSMAQQSANYFNKPVYGAKSGSHIEYFIKGVWISGYNYPKIYGKKFPHSNEYSDIRLHPDRGDYYKFLPTP